MWTLSALQMHPHSMVVCDEDATLELQVKTVKVRMLFFEYMYPADTRKYFKSIEVVASRFGFTQAIPISVSRATPVTDVNVGRLGLDAELKAQQEQAKKELATIAESQELAPPIEPLSRAVTPELSPDSMASRIPRSAKGATFGVVTDELSFDRMGSRIVASSVVV